MTYEQAERMLGKRSSKRLEHETYLVRRGPSTIAVRYHWTDVVTLHADGSRSFATGGYHSVTTKKRMNDYGGVRVSQKDWAWTLNGVSFWEGMTVRADGSIAAPKF